VPITPEQRRRRDQVEAFIRLIAPGLNLLLAAGERLSRIASPDDDEYYPVRSGQVDPQIGASERREPVDR
jgi:hypothetical protein